MRSAREIEYSDFKAANNFPQVAPEVHPKMNAFSNVEFPTGRGANER
jgi:hypothetical protein